MGADNSKEAPPAPPSYWQIVRTGYDELVNAIIRPPRAEYEIEQLGPSSFIFCKKRFQRHDLVLVNRRGFAMQCSHWEPVERPAEALPCVVFVHGNSSARLEGINQLSLCIAFGATLFSFDCAGSGKSEGKYVSLGYYEKDDLRVVVDHLRGSGTVSTIAVWGRSMGAVTGILYQEQDLSLVGDHTVDAMILDSPFSDFCQLAEELVDKGKEHGVHVPRMVTRMAIQMLKGSVEKVAGFSIRDLNPIDYVDRCMLPTLFMCARHDDFVGMHHTKLIYEKYAGPKEIIMVDGDHNSLRNEQALTAAGVFLQRQLKIPPSWAIPYSAQYFGLLPWRCGPSKKKSRPVAEGGTDGEVGMTREKQAQVKGKVANAFGGLLGQRGENGGGGKDGGGEIDKEMQWRLDQAHYYCNRGNALEENGKIDAAIRAYRAAITYHAEYPDAHYNLGIALKNQGRIDEAIREYRKTVKYKPDHADAYNNLGVALEEKGLIEEAVEAYRISIKHNHEHAEAHCNLADALQSIGRLDEAVAEYHIAIAQNPQDADTINNLGVALEAKGQIDGAIMAYSTAVANRPSHWDAQCNLADALHLRGDYDKAAEVYRLILQNNPKDAQIHSSLGNVLHAKGEHAAALAAYREAVKLNPQDTVTHNNMGIVLQTMGNIEEATRAYRAALAQDPTYAIAHYNLGVALQSKNRLAEAISAYRNAVQHRENYADAYNNMGYALQAQGHLDEAIDAYRSAIRTRPDFANARSNLEKVLELQKKRGSKPAPAASSGSMGGFSDDGASSERGSMERKSSIMGSLFGEGW